MRPGSVAGDRGDLIVYFSGSWWVGPPGHDRHLAQALSRHSPVLFVEPPVSILTRLNHPHLAGVARQPSLQIHGPRLAHLSPRVVPGMSRPGLHRLVAPMLRHAARAAVRDLYGRRGGPVAAVVSSRLDDVWAALPTDRRLFYATDDLVAGAELLGLPRARLVQDEARTLRGATAVAAVSQALVDRYERAGYPAELLPNGCDTDAFANVDHLPPPEDTAVADLRGPVAGMVGQINDRIDIDFLEAVAGTGRTLLLVGPHSPGAFPERFAALVARPNVRWTGARPAAVLPGYLRLIDVGLSPYVDSAFNRASFPLKTLEYLAAGRRAVATPLPAHTWLGTDLVTLATTPDRFAAAVEAELTRPRSADEAAVRRAFAREHGWHRRAEELAKLLGLTAGTPAPPRSGPSAPDG